MLDCIAVRDQPTNKSEPPRRGGSDAFKERPHDDLHHNVARRRGNHCHGPVLAREEGQPDHTGYRFSPPQAPLERADDE